MRQNPRTGPDGDIRAQGDEYKTVLGFSGPPELIPGLGQRDAAIKALAEAFLAATETERVEGALDDGTQNPRHRDEGST